jgi:hypothetical protein
MWKGRDMELMRSGINSPLCVFFQNTCKDDVKRRFTIKMHLQLAHTSKTTQRVAELCQEAYTLCHSYENK